MLSVFAIRSTIESFLKLSYCKPVKIKFWHLTLLKVGRESSLKFVENFPHESLLNFVDIFPHESLLNLWVSIPIQNWT